MIDEALLARRVHHLATLSPHMAFANLVTATLLMIPVWQSGADIAGHWYAGMIAYSLFLLVIKIYLSLGSWRAADFSGAPYAAIIVGSVGGLLWGSAGISIALAGSIAQQATILVAQAFVLTAVAVIWNFLPRLCYPFLLCASLPLVLSLIAAQGTDHYILAAVVSVFTTTLIAGAYHGNRRFEHGVRSHFMADEASAYLEDAISSSDEAFAVYAPDGQPVIANDRYCRFFGEPEKIDCLTDKKSEIVQLDDGRWLKSNWHRTRHGGYVLTCADVTEMKRRETDLVHARDRAESANRAKTEFLALMSHELRTPLNAIIGFSDALRLGIVDLNNKEKIGEYTSHIVDSGRHLLNLINDILDLSKIEAGKYDMHEEEVDLAELGARVCSLLKTEAKKYGVTLINEVSEEPVVLLADKRMLNQMLLNLLSNAIKFSHPGGDVHLASALQNQEFIIEIIDRGIGISEADLAKVFEPFYQVENQLSRTIEGTGLGVSIVKRLIEHHGGRLSLQSAVGTGTTARLHFPLHRRLEKSRAESSQSDAVAAHL